MGQYLAIQTETTAMNLFPDIPEVDEEREDDDDTWVDLSFEDRIKRNLAETEKSIK